jgi:hypothetical protein
MTKNVLLFFLSFFPLIISAQKKDTSKNVVGKEIYAFEIDDFFDRDTLRIDTTINDFQVFNPAFDSLHLRPLWLGNLGQPAVSAYKTDFFPSGYFQKSYSNYLEKFGRVKFYDTRSFYTQLFYFTNGSKENNLQSISFLHTQNINKNFNFAVKYNIYASDGVYSFQKGKFANFLFSTHYHGRKYQMTAFIRNRQFKNQYNGGIASFDYFSSNFATINFPVNLTSASVKNRFFDIVIKHKINLGKKIFLFAKNKYFLGKYYYLDKPSQFYSFAIDTTQTNDSAFSYSFNNSVGTGVELGKLKFLAYGGYNILRYVNAGNMYDFYDVPAEAELKYISSRFHFSSGLRTYVSGYHQGSMLSNLKAVFKLSDKMKVSGVTRFYVFKPDFYYNKLNFNNVVYTQELKNVRGLSYVFSFGYKRTFLLLGGELANNPILFDSLGVPKNLEANVSNVFYGVRSSGAWRHISWSATAMMRQASKNNISLPAYSGYASLYYKGWLVKNVLKTHIGLQAFVTSDFIAPGFFPANSVFYYSYKRTKPPVSIDLFLNFKLKRARFFFILSNLNYGLSGFSMPVYTVYPYPWVGRVFRFGIAWNFYDKK